VKVPVEFNALGELPGGWSWQPLQNLTANPKQDVVDGPFGSNLKASEYVSSGVPIARLQNIDRNTFVTKNIRFLTPEKAADLARHEFRPDDILITKLGDPLGKACIVPASIGHGVIVADVVRVRPDETLVDRKYLTYAINSPKLVKQFELHTKGTTRPRVNLSILRQLPIPLAPRAKQTEIVAEIEKQFSRLDEAVANLQRVKANLKRYKASVLKDAVEGRLVPLEAELARRDGRTFETGEQLLQRILEARRKEWKGRGKCKEPVAANTAGLTPMPSGWTWATIEQLTYLVTSGSRGWGDFYSDNGVLFIRAQDIKTDALNMTGLARVDVPVDAEGSRSSVNANDILVTITGANVTKSALVPMLSEPAFVSQHVALLKLTSSETAAFVFNWLVSPANGRKTLEKWAYGAGKPGLSLEQVRALTVALPPQAEQNRICEEVERRLSLVRGVEAEVDVNLKRAHSLRQSNLHKQFNSDCKRG
jgi:type I restriction enzyme, S subunit